jgi:hypothetical protein
MAQVIKLDVIIPTRIEGNWKLTQKEQDCIVWSILSGCSLDKAYLAFVHPEMATSPKALKMYANQFASSVEVRNYISGYQERLNSFFSNLRGENKPTVKPATPTTAPLSAEERAKNKRHRL